MLVAATRRLDGLAGGVQQLYPRAGLHTANHPYFGPIGLEIGEQGWRQGKGQTVIVAASQSAEPRLLFASKRPQRRRQRYLFQLDLKGNL